MSSPTPASKRSPSPNQKRSLRSRVGTLARRSSSFLIPSRPSTPSARSDSEDPLASSGAATPTKVSSKPASIRSIERLASVPMVLPHEKKSEEQKADTAPVEAPAPVEVAPAAPESVPEPASEPMSEPAAEPVVPETLSVEEQKPPEEPYAPVYLPANSEAPEAAEREEPHPEKEHEHEPSSEHFHIPVSDSPKSLSAVPSHDSFEHTDSTPSVEPAPETPSESPNHPRSLSVKTSRENMLTELSPIPEDERSALEERSMPFARPNGMPPSGLSAPPLVAPTLSGRSGGTTPRAMPIPVVGLEEHQPHDAEKGKEKDVNGFAAHTAEGLPQDDYFSSVAPMPVPRVPDEHYYSEDPFKDPEPALASTTHYDGMPEPDTHGYDALEERGAVEPLHPAPAAQSMPVAYPLPPLDEVTSGNLRTVPSDYTLGARSSRAPSIHNEVETDETLPLLFRSKNATTDAFGKPVGPSHRNHQYGEWIAYALPDSTTYYSHPGMRITTDIDMQNPRKLASVTSYIDKRLANEMTLPAEGLEIWLHDEGLSREDFVPVRCWVDHGARALGYWPPPAYRAEGPSHVQADDRLDFEYRYWAFMESHPAHTPLPTNAYSEAMDKLTWSYTDRLLKSNRRAPPPFTQHESQELIAILRSTSDEGSESSVQAAVQTRVVARILRRIVQWKQHFFRPEKPLPRGMDNVYRTQRGAPYRKTFLDFVVAWLCLGIPYLYANRHAYRFDEEGGVMRSAGPMLIVGATVCIVAATILVASLTFLALPGLDHVSRTAGFIAILGSFASLGASVIAAFRNHVEVQRMAARGGEGLVVTMSALTGSSILPSLPAVFLAWSILSLVTGVVLYAFRGSVAIDPSHWTKFASFTRWTTVGVLGFCGGVLIASMFSIRR